ncbi:MAG: tetratricopeptide repeat protein [Ignavibacteriaceae bacterium]|nr:tetratricopeptide repeat protein [Ignavibacteriaceae bacterium]
MKHFIRFIFILLLIPFTQVFTQTVEEMISEGDKLVAEFKNQKALEVLLEAEKKFPDNYEILWRISRSYIDYAEHLPDKTDEQKDEQEKLYKKALEYADRSVKLAPDQAITYVRRSIANGRIALFEGVFSAIGTVKDVREDCEKAIQIGNGGNYVQALAHYVFGRTHFKVCEKAYLIRLPLGLGWGDMDESIRLLETAIKLKPNFRMFYLDLAKAYIEEDEYDKARETLLMIEKAPVTDEDDGKFLAESKQLLEEIKDE